MGKLYIGIIVVPLWLEDVMLASLTLKNAPDEVYARLKAAAQMHRRSLNSQAIVCLETVLMPPRWGPANALHARASYGRDWAWRSSERATRTR